MALVDLLTDLSNFKYTDYDNAGINTSQKSGRHGGYKGDGQPPHPEEHSKFDDKSGVNLSQIKGRHGGTEGPTPAQPPHSKKHSIYDDGVGFGVAPNDNPQTFDVRGYTITGTKTFDRPNQDAITIMTNGVGFPYTPFDSGVKTGPVNFLSGVYGSWGTETLPLGFSFNMVDSLLSPGTPPVLSLNTLRHTIPEVGPSPSFTIDYSRYDVLLGSQFNSVDGIISSQYTDTEKLHSSYGTQFHISGFNRDDMYIANIDELSTPIFKTFTRGSAGLGKIGLTSPNFNPFEFGTDLPYVIPQITATGPQTDSLEFSNIPKLADAHSIDSLSRLTGYPGIYIASQGEINQTVGVPIISSDGITFTGIDAPFNHTTLRSRLYKVYQNHFQPTDINFVNTPLGTNLFGENEAWKDGSVHIGSQDIVGAVGGGVTYYGSLVSITPRGSIYRNSGGQYQVPQEGRNTNPPGGISGIPEFTGTQITHNIPQITLSGPFGDENYQSTLQLTPKVDDAHGSDFMTSPLANYVSDFHPTYPITVHESGFDEFGSFYFYNNKGPSSFGEFKKMTKSDDGIKTMEFGKMGIVGSLTLGKEDVNFPDRIPYNIPARDNNVIGFDQPFILKKIGDKWGPWGLGAIDEGIFRGGFVTSAARTVADVKRIGKFILTPKGIMFGLKQVILQKLNPRKETRTWNPLSLGSLAPMVHINRHWGHGTYEEAIDKDGWDSDGFGSILDGYADAVISPVPSVGLIFTTGRRTTLAHAVAMVPSRGGKMALPGIPELKWSDFPVGNIDSLSKNIVGENKFGLSGLFGLGKKEYLTGIKTETDGKLQHEVRYPLHSVSIPYFAKSIKGTEKSFQWQSDKWNIGTPYATSDSTPTLAKLQSDPNEKITLGHAGSVIAKSKRIHINKKDVVTAGTSQGSLHTHTTKFDHENADGDGVKYTLPTGITTIHGGINIYKKGTLYLTGIKTETDGKLQHEVRYPLHSVSIPDFSLSVEGLSGKPFEWKSDKWNIGTPYDGKNLTTIQTVAGNQIQLGYIGSVIGKKNIVHKGGLTPDGATLGSPFPVTTKLDHESDGKESKVFGEYPAIKLASQTHWHDGKNIYNTDDKYIITEIMSGRKDGRLPPSDEKRKQLFIGKEFWQTNIFGSSDKPFSWKADPYSDEVLYTKSGKHTGNDKWIIQLGRIDKYSATKKNVIHISDKFSFGDNEPYVVSYDPLGTIDEKAPYFTKYIGAGKITDGGFEGDLYGDGGHLWPWADSKINKYSIAIASSKEQPPGSLLKLTRLQLDNTTGDPTVFIKTSHPQSSARFQTAGVDTLKKPIKLQDFPLLNKTETGTNFGLEGQALGYVQDSRGLFGNLFGLETRYGHGQHAENYTALMSQPAVDTLNIKDDNITIDKILPYSHQNLSHTQVVPVQDSSKIKTKGGTGKKKHYEIEKVTKNLGEKFPGYPLGAIKSPERSTPVAVGSGALIDTYSTLAYGKLNTTFKEEEVEGKDDQGIHDQLNYEKTLRSASEINKSFAPGGRGEIIESESSVKGVSGGENAGRRDRAKQWKADAQGRPGKPDPAGVVWKIFNDDGLKGLVKKSVDGTSYKTALTDKINMLKYGEDYDVHEKDFIKFKFRDLINKKWIIFRAALGSISEEFSPEWSSERYIGRPDQVHVYQGVNRSLSFEFMIVPHTRQELPILWEKLNYLVGLTYPTWKSVGDFGKRMESPFINLTIGDMHVNTPGFLSGLTVTVDDNSPWEIEEGFQLPHAINVSCEFTHIGRHVLASQGKHYDLGWLKEYDSSEDWKLENNPQLSARNQLVSLMGT